MGTDEHLWETLGVAGSLSASYSRDARSLMPLLASTLQAAMPTSTTVKRKFALFGSGDIRQIEFSTPDYIYALDDTGRAALAATRRHIVRGISVKTEDLEVGDWLKMVSEAIMSDSRASERARDAIRNFVA